jgi:hypothetical protein
MRRLESSYKAGALGLAGILFICIGNSPPLAGERSSQSTEQSSALSSAILTKAQLTPPLRTSLVELRFSPDGKYIVAQDESTIYVLTREPLSVRFQIDVQGIPAARFSPDSQRLIVATGAMGVEWRALPDGKILGTTVLGSGKPCYDAQLSPQGDIYACIDGDVVLRLFDIAKNQPIFAEKIGEVPSSYVAPKSAGGSARVPQWWSPLARNLPVLQTSIHFSTDARFVIASSFDRQSIGVDLINKTRISLKEHFPPTINERSLEFIAPDRLIVQEGGRTGDLAILSFPTGGTIGRLPYVGRVTLASDPRYAFASARESDQISVIDLQAGSTMQKLHGEKADVLGGDVVRYDRAHDEIILSRTNDPESIAKLQLPVGSISLMNAAAVSRDLRAMAIGMPGNGGVFQTSVGRRIAEVENLESAWFDENERWYAEVSQRDGSVGLEKFELTGDSVSSVSVPWFVAVSQKKERLMFSGPTVLSILPAHWCSTAFEKVTALNLRTGNQLWSRKYNPEMFFQYDTDVPPLWEDVGVPFADLQGTRFIFGWNANTKIARKAAKQASGAVQNQMKTATISKQDSFFEVVDALEGTTVGGTLVQHSAGPGSFDGAFSAGDWLILASGGRRFSVFSLSSGKELLHSFALYAALSGEKGLLGLAEGHDAYRFTT